MSTEKFPVPPVHFNHLYIVLDDKTYRAIQGSDFLRSAFPGRELRSTLTAAGERWSGTYFYCQDNYLEFFGESTGRHWRASAQKGWSGLAFSIDQPGGVAQVRREINTQFHYSPYYELRQLNNSGVATNWFHYVRLSEQLGLESFDSWVMEYHPDIFNLKQIKIPVSGELSRRAYLSPWNRNDLPSPSRERRHEIQLFSRVTSATILMDTVHALKYSQVLQALGFTKKEETGQVILSNNRFSLIIHIRPEAASGPVYRISSIQLEMVRPSIAPMTFVFAPGSRLILNENLTADWLFEG